jgi:type I restriction enzyme S subunit
VTWRDAPPDLPVGWAWATVGEITEAVLGKMLDSKKQSGQHAMRYLRNTNVQWHHVDAEDTLSMDVAPHERERFTVRTGDLLVCEGGEPGRCAIVPPAADGLAFQKALHRLRPESGFDVRYLAYAFQASATLGHLDGQTTGSTIRHLPQERLRGLTLPLAPSAEQSRIADLLDEHLAGLARVDAALGALSRRLDSLALVVANSAVKGRLVDCPVGDVKSELDQLGLLRSVVAGQPLQPVASIPDLPEGWACVSVDQVSAAIDYGTSSRAHPVHSPGDVPVLRMGNIKNGRILFRNLKYLPEGHKDAAMLRLDDGDLLFNRTNSAEHVGKTAVFSRQQEIYTWASYLIRCRFLPGVNPAWVSLAMNSPSGRHHVRSVVSQQVGQANVNGTKLRGFPIPLPPLATQNAVVAVASQYLDLIDLTRREVARLRTRGERLPRSLLQAAFEGCLVPQDPDDEHAELLLKRTAENRVGITGVGRQRKSRTTTRARSVRRTVEEETL